MELTYDELTKMPARSQVSLLECAGNSRAFLTPKAKGVQWDLGAVGNAEWTGVPLAAVLDRVGVQKGAVEVVLEGADEGEIKEEPKSPGIIHFARSLPLEKARKPEVLLVYLMNGKELPTAPRFPHPGGGSGMVRDGVGQVAQPNHLKRPAIPGFFSDARLQLLRAKARGSEPCARH